MTLALCTLSHSPLIGVNQPAPDVVAEVDGALARAREHVRAFSPDLAVIFGPDHFNGVFYDMLPPFCVGAGAESIGDWRTSAGPLAVDTEAARTIHRQALAAGLDLAVSERMQVDHGIAQPLEFLFGSIDAVPVVPVFVNCAAPPLGPTERIRLLGEAVGRAVSVSGRRVLLIGSGGLSHDPPIPALEGASPEVAERLIAGRNPDEDTVATRVARVVATAQELAAGTSDRAPLAPEWDAEVMETLARGRLSEFDSWSPEDFAAEAGNAAHEVRTWIAAFAALGTAGAYRVTSTYYRPIPEWIAGFAIMTAVVDEQKVTR
ncbi:3-carboxyethylcatechol 2,3-dioxygenase [Nocardioides humi]|uniref:2,3-dihydroxyphenylpropionate/2,3-dihydroxicinnamic acid 1,2-dioxygenase n=1 Tax=Nocardioides humi TaxID=449461 RepID=A0ABN2A6E0_9ACTN|nr:3-carboxyethylcatechol 2,3-dioxygenase [Nocardioides humi]